MVGKYIVIINTEPVGKVPVLYKSGCACINYILVVETVKLNNANGVY